MAPITEKEREFMCNVVGDLLHRQVIPDKSFVLESEQRIFETPATAKSDTDNLKERKGSPGITKIKAGSVEELHERVTAIMGSTHKLSPPTDDKCIHCQKRMAFGSAIKCKVCNGTI